MRRITRPRTREYAPTKEEFVRKEDYLKNRKDRYQAKFKFSV